MRVWRGLTGTFRERRVYRDLKLSIERRWYVLWSPTGFGGTTRRAIEVEELLKRVDSKAVTWYPLYPEVLGSRTYMRAVYAGYMLVYCIWTSIMEDVLIANLPLHAVFLKDEDTLLPIPILDERVEETKRTIVEFEKDISKFLHLSGLGIGTEVYVTKKPFSGSVGKIQTFLSKNQVVVVLPMFYRSVPVVLHSRDLKPV